MFVFLGSYSGGNVYGSSDDDDSQDDESTDNYSQTGVDDFSGGGGGGDSEQDSDDDEGAAAGVAGAAGAAAGAASGAAAGAGAVTGSPEGKDPEECDEAEDGEECEDEDEVEHESPDAEEPDTDREDDVDEHDREEDTNEEDADDEEEDDDDDDEYEEVVVRQEVDALSAMSWCVQPVMKRVEECYSEEVDIFYRPAPVRDLDPEVEKQKWQECSDNLGMPVDPSFWDDSSPESTELVNKAFKAAIQQGRGMDYLRALWRNGIAAGRNISNQEVLINLASDLGFNTDRFEEDLKTAELETGDRGELPFTYMEIHGQAAPKNGRVRYTDFRTQFTFQGVDEERPQQLRGFVRENGPVATVEVMEVYEMSDRGKAVQCLRDLDGVSSFEVGGERFWTI